MTNQVRWYDFTIHQYEEDLQEIIKKLKKSCSEWKFQEERAPTTDKLHLQGRMKLTGKGLRLSTCVKRFPGWHLSQTCNTNIDSWDYVIKSETRVRGPYSSLDVGISELPHNLRDLKDKFKSWQKSILEISKIYNDRSINFVIDTIGGIGKTHFVNYCDLTKLAQSIPNLPSSKDTMRAVFDLEVRPIYFFDLPRALCKTKMNEFYTALETIKGGVCYDDRYTFRKKIFAPPNIWVFTNKFPEDLSLLSADRWVFWEVINDELVGVNHPSLSEYPSDLDYISDIDSNMEPCEDSYDSQDNIHNLGSYDVELNHSVELDSSLANITINNKIDEAVNDLSFNDEWLD